MLIILDFNCFQIFFSISFSVLDTVILIKSYYPLILQVCVNFNFLCSGVNHNPIINHQYLAIAIAAIITVIVTLISIVLYDLLNLSCLCNLFVILSCVPEMDCKFAVMSSSPITWMSQFENFAR